MASVERNVSFCGCDFEPNWDKRKLIFFRLAWFRIVRIFQFHPKQLMLKVATFKTLCLWYDSADQRDFCASLHVGIQEDTNVPQPFLFRPFYGPVMYLLMFNQNVQDCANSFWQKPYFITKFVQEIKGLSAF